MKNDRKSATFLGYVLIPGFIIVILLVVLNYFIYQSEFGFFRNIYNNEVAGTTSLISRRFQSALVAVESTRAFFISSNSVEPQEFDLYASVLTKNVVSGAIAMPITVEWIDANNNIKYVYPMNADNAKVVGTDLNQYPNRLLPIIKAKNIKSSVVTEPIMLGQGYPGLLLYSPIFKSDNTYLGQAVVVMRLSNLLAPIPGSNPTYNKNEYIQTGKFIIPFDDDMIFNENGERVSDPAGDLVKDPIANEYAASVKGVVSENIVFADKTWQLRFSPTYIQLVNQRIGVYIGFSLLFALSIIIFLWVLQMRQKRLFEEKARTEALIVGIGDGLVACDKNGIITFANKKAEELSGYSISESVGQSYYKVWQLLDNKGRIIPQEERLFYRALTRKEVINISTLDHLYMLKKDGSRFPFSSTIAPIIVNGDIQGAIVVFRDITKESEVDKMKTEFLSLASHQLLTPSSAVKWTSEILLAGDKGKLNKKQTESIKNIYNSNESIISLVSSLLNISRIESGRIMVNPAPTSLNSLVSETIKELENKIENKSQSVVFNPDENLQKINIDPVLVKQIYKNLLSNAIKYTPAKGKIIIKISRNNNDIVSEISDNGYGIVEKDKKKIFEKFYRGENITAIEKDGNGLGLYLVKQIVEVSGGKIWFESKINEGTTFWFSLPIVGSKMKEGQVTVS